MKRVSSFTVIVAFVCLALVGVALIPLLPVKLNPSRSLPGFTVGFSMPGTSSRVVEMEVTSKLEILIQQYAEEHIKPRLANIPGIYKVELSGATPMEWRLEYDSEQLRLLGVTLSDISEAVQRHYRKEFLGTHNVDTGNGSREWIRLTLVPESNSLGFNPIREELDKIYFRTGLTVLILLVFVWLITRKLKYLFLIVTSLAVNIAVALIFYYLFGLEMQLYSLAGITVSLNLVIDSTIVMTDHILHRRNLKAFLSVLAATLTTMGALVIIFFLDEKIRLNLQDFAAVVIINLAVSLMVALFFVPSMIEKIGLVRRITGKKRRLVLPLWTRRWAAACGFSYRRCTKAVTSPVMRRWCSMPTPTFPMAAPSSR